MTYTIPVVLFAYSRPVHLRRVLACLRENNIPLLYAFSDGPKTMEVAGRVDEVRNILRSIDWCDMHLVERTENLGLGKSILTGVTEMFQKHESIIVYEDDLICVPGTYEYLCNAMEYYKNDPRVMSVTGFNDPGNTPQDVLDQPYFDGRADCWVWGTWARAWKGMDIPAMKIMKTCKQKGIDVFKYGANLPRMAEIEIEQNIWAVRFSYLHILKGGLCLRPPHSMVEHIGFDELGTNNKFIDLVTLPLKKCPPIPGKWPVPIENPECPEVWQRTNGGKPDTIVHRVARRLGKLFNRISN